MERGGALKPPSPLPLSLSVWFESYGFQALPERTENWEQRQLVKWVRKFPWGQLLFHIPNENHHHDTPLGVRSGVPDLMLPIPMDGKHGLFIEMKRADGGRLSEAQRKWLGWLTELGYEAVCCHGWQEAREVIERYMDVR